MSSSDIERSSGTPALTQGDDRLKASIRQALTPDMRNRAQWSEDVSYQPAEILGDILDTAPPDCTYWAWWWSKRNGEVGIARRPCGNRACPTCAPIYLAERVAPAVKVWGRRALRAEYQSQRQWKRRREEARIHLRGPAAEPGLLVIRHGDVVVVWAPVHVPLDGVVLSGKRLREQLVADLRAIPLPAYAPPKGISGDTPRPIGAARDVEHIERNAQRAGIPLKAGKRRYTTAPADEEQGRRFVELMRSR